MDMKLRGMYIARQLSFHGVSFKIDEVPLSPEFTNVYDNAVKLVSYEYILIILFFMCIFINNTNYTLNVTISITIF